MGLIVLPNIVDDGRIHMALPARVVLNPAAGTGIEVHLLGFLPPRAAALPGVHGAAIPGLPRGTIFLDEIGDLDLSSQVKMLRVLQDRTYEPLGSSTTKTVDVRVVSATNRDLVTMVSEGLFREDLLYRLNLITLKLPPLRNRPDDIGVLANHFLRGFTNSYGRPPLTLAADALEWLKLQPWRGNVRELRQTLERAVLVLDGQNITAASLRNLSKIAEQDERDESKTGFPQAGTMTLEHMEALMIEKCLDHYHGNLTRVSEALGLTRASLYRRLKKHNLDPRQH